MLGIAFLAVAMVLCYSTIACAVAAALWLLLCRALDMADRRRSRRGTRRPAGGDQAVRRCSPRCPACHPRTTTASRSTRSTGS